MSLYKDKELPQPSNGLAHPSPTQTPASATNAQRLALESIVALSGIVVILIILAGTPLKDSVTKTVQRVGRSITLEGQLSAQWFKEKTNNQ